MTDGTHTGTCFCGAVAIEARGAPFETGYCHCASCRSYSGAPMIAFTLWTADAVSVTRGAELLGLYAKTPFSQRRFCTTCGGHIMTEHPSLGCIDVLAAAIPSLVFKPALHVNYAEAVLRVKDGLPKFKDFPSAAGGSGDTMAE